MPEVNVLYVDGFEKEGFSPRASSRIDLNKAVVGCSRRGHWSRIIVQDSRDCLCISQNSDESLFHLVRWQQQTG